jgi:hypothetical protein
VNGPGPELEGPLTRAWLCLDALADALEDVRRRLESGNWRPGEPLDERLLAILAGHLQAAAASLNAEHIAGHWARRHPADGKR